MKLTSLKLVQEIETQAILAQRDINVVKTAVTAKQRDVRLLELTTSEVKSLPRDTNVYEGVGKMWVSHLGLCEGMFNPHGQVRPQSNSDSGEAALV